MADTATAEIRPEADEEERPLTEAEEKKRQQEIEDEKYKANEIKFGLRYKLIALFSVIIFGIALSITIIAVNNQTESLMAEKITQGKIINRGLGSAINARLFGIYSRNLKRLKKLKTKEGYLEFYRENEIDIEIIEDVKQVKNQPDVVYAYILGEHGILLGHTEAAAHEPYSDFSFPAGTDSYFKLYKAAKAAGQMKKPQPITRTINEFPVYAKDDKGQLKRDANGKPIVKETKQLIDFSYLIAFKDDPALEDAVGEVHIGIDLQTVNDRIFDSKVELQFIGLIAIVFGILAAIVFATLLSNPMRRMIEGMQMVSQGNFSASVLVKSKDEVGLMSKTFNMMLKGMSILVSPEVAQKVLSGDVNQSERKDVTVMFSDIRSFTTISEKLTPREVVLMLNEYLEIMTDIIIKYGGVVDKFVGDEIFAAFGTPFDHPMHPLAACATAVEMGIELEKHNQQREADEKPPIRIGIGVNSGEVIAGAMGSTKRVDYTSIGDAVNLGARLEGTNKVYGTLSICSEFTYAHVKGDVVVRELDLIRVKGKNEPVKIFEVVDLTPQGQQKIDQYLVEKKAADEAKNAQR